MLFSAEEISLLYMNKPNKIAIIGCGGIACQLIGLLGLDYNLLLVDGDDFEAKNSKRQFPALNKRGINKNKAVYLAELMEERTAFKINFIPKYLEGLSIVNNPEWSEIDMIISCVDNRQSREIINQIANQQDIPAILCGNEEYMGEAHLSYPGIYDPFMHHDFGPMTKAPFACTSDENQNGTQTSSANFLAAAACVHILMAWCKTDNPENLIIHSLLDVRANSTRKRLRDAPLLEACAGTA